VGQKGSVLVGRLTALKVKSLVQPGRYGDGDGLWLQVRDAGRRSWLFRYTWHGRERQMGLGALNQISLADAREAAQAAAKLLREGKDPLGERAREAEAGRATNAAATFEEVAEMFIRSHEGTWRNTKHRAQWRATLATYAFPDFGNRPVSQIAVAELMRVLEPIWRTKPETASRLRGRIESVLDYAGARGWRSGDNPARWRGHLSNLLPARSKVARVKHHAALAWPQISDFMSDLRNEPGTAARALEFIVLTASRTGEVLGATWAEIDLAARVWTVPADRMKAGRAHRVPLSNAAAALLGDLPARNQDDGDYIFPGAKLGRPLSKMAPAMLLRRMKLPDITVHGFRSTFRDWAAERTNFTREVAEAALAHTLRDKVEAAYRRGDLFEKRREMMEAWAHFCGEVEAVRPTAPQQGTP
jgi:integrase